MMRLQLLHERLKESLRQYERERMQHQEKDRQLTNKNKLLSTKLKAEKDEVSARLVQSKLNIHVLTGLACHKYSSNM